MKRKYGAGRARETEAEKKMREAALAMRDNSHNYGSKNRMGSPRRGKLRGIGKH